jgi:hypothetical protein
MAHTTPAPVVFTPYDDVAWRTFKASTETGHVMWAFGRSAKSGVWFLRDHDGYIRTLDRTWIDSAPMIQRTVENYGFTCTVN